MTSCLIVVRCFNAATFSIGTKRQQAAHETEDHTVTLPGTAVRPLQLSMPNSEHTRRHCKALDSVSNVMTTVFHDWNMQQKRQRPTQQKPC